MVTSERLYSAGILDLFDKATKSGDRQEMIKLLRSVDFSEADAAKIADATLSQRRSHIRFSKRIFQVLGGIIAVAILAAMVMLPQHWPILLFSLVTLLAAYRSFSIRKS